MKKFIFISILFLAASSCINAQSYLGEYSDFFDTQQPDARSEAFGKIQVTGFGNPLTMFYNPASTSFSKGLNLEYTHRDRQYYYFPNNETFNTFGASINTKKYNAIGFGVRYLSYGEQQVWYNAAPAISHTYTPVMVNYCVNYSLVPIKDFSVGINVNYFEDKTIERNKRKAWYIDLGVLKRFTFTEQANKQNLILGLSVSNITHSKVDGIRQIIPYYIDPPARPLSAESVTDVVYQTEVPLPTNYRIGASYDFELKQELLGYKFFKILLAAEASDLANTALYSTLKTGAEFTFMEMLKLRMGYYSERIKLEMRNRDKDKQTEFTCGFGLDLPISKLFNISTPFSLQVDYANLKVPERTFYNINLDNTYSVLNINLNVGI